MNTLLWIAQWAIAVFLLVSFLAMPSLIRRGVARNNVTAVLMSCFGLACSIGLVVPWWTGRAMLVTPVAASLVVLSSLGDSLTNRMPVGDALYLALLVVMGVTVALGRFRSFGQWHDSFGDWFFVVGGTLLLVVCLLGSPAGPARTRLLQAGTGLAGILGGALGQLES
ncbi:hypothetical protein [Streptomyces sp. Agncl-13]|uniref:hypothetical protein n=1 Tax=Streptomyces sp. Agncl-13 TaxID=3400628 RepID=UPI003A8880AC